MRKRNTPLRLAQSPNHWTEIDEIIHQNVRTVCFRYDDPEQARAFLWLADLMTNPRYESGDREMVAHEAIREAFHYTRECDQAQENYMKNLEAPPVKQIATA